MASIIVTAGSGRTTIAVHRGSSEWISFLPQILAFAGCVLIAVLAAFLVFHFRARMWSSPGPWVALVTCLGALFGVCMQSIQNANYLGSRSVLTIDGLYLTVGRTRPFLFMTSQPTLVPLSSDFVGHFPRLDVAWRWIVRRADGWAAVQASIA
jgi:hypothetical protein